MPLLSIRKAPLLFWHAILILSLWREGFIGATVAAAENQCFNNDKTSQCSSETTSSTEQQQEDDDYGNQEEQEENYEKQWGKYLLAEGTLDEISSLWLECDKLNPTDGSTSPNIPDDATWALLRKTYQEILVEEGLQEAVPNSYLSTQQSSGFLIPIQVKYSQEMGRGVYAQDYVPKGTPIYKTIHAAEFHSAFLYRKFLFALPPHMACDVMMWAYTVRRQSNSNDDEKEDAYMVCVDLDEGTLSNDCSAVPENCNVMIPQEHYQTEENFDQKNKARGVGCDQGVYYASRDIRQGEQILADYSLFVSEGNGWEWLGLESSNVNSINSDNDVSDGDEEDYEDYGQGMDDDDQSEEYLLEHGTLDELYDWLECDSFIPPDGSSLPIPTAATWTIFRATYEHVMNQREDGLQETVPTISDQTSFLVPIQAKYTETMGRGLFANAFLPKGTPVWKAKNTAEFHSAILYRRFLLALPPSLACDAMPWTYPASKPKTTGEEEENAYVLCLEFDDGVLANDCEYEDCNILVPKANRIATGGCDPGVYISTRDIQKGEQLLSPYALFVVEGKAWEWLGLGEHDINIVDE